MVAALATLLGAAAAMAAAKVAAVGYVTPVSLRLAVLWLST